MFGEEDLLVEESLQALRTRATDAGIDERLSMLAGPGFDWGQLKASTQTLSLFSERRLVELRLPSGRPGEAGTKALVEYSEHPDPDTTFIVICGRLDTAQRNAKWFKALSSAGVAVDHRSLPAEQFPAWLKDRLAQHGLKTDAEVLRWLAHTLEGNLLAAAQEVEKLVLACPDGNVTMEVVLDQVADHARFSVFNLVETVLQGSLTKGLRILRRIHSEGVEPILVLWALTREIRMLAALAQVLAAGRPRGQAFQQFNIWARRAPAVGAALSRHTTESWQDLVRRLAVTDRQLKGRGPNSSHHDIWLALEHLCVEICLPGCAPVTPNAA